MADEKGGPEGDGAGGLNPRYEQAILIQRGGMNTYHRMVLEVLRGEGAQRNGDYQRRRRFLPIKPQKVRPLTEGEAAFAMFKGVVDRTQRQMKAPASWISQETWCLANRRTSLLRTGRANAMEARQLRREF